MGLSHLDKYKCPFLSFLVICLISLLLMSPRNLYASTLWGLLSFPQFRKAPYLWALCLPYMSLLLWNESPAFETQLSGWTPHAAKSSWPKLSAWTVPFLFLWCIPLPTIIRDIWLPTSGLLLRWTISLGFFPPISSGDQPNPCPVHLSSANLWDQSSPI